MSFQCSFLVVSISRSFVMVIDTNTRVKYLTGNIKVSGNSFYYHQMFTGLSPLYKADGTLDTVSVDELQYLLKKVSPKMVDPNFDMYHASDPGHISLHKYEI